MLPDFKELRENNFNFPSEVAVQFYGIFLITRMNNGTSINTYVTNSNSLSRLYNTIDYDLNDLSLFLIQSATFSPSSSHKSPDFVSKTSLKANLVLVKQKNRSAIGISVCVFSRWTVNL